MTQLFSFYRADDGMFTGDTYAGQDLESATPPGCLAIAGRFNAAAQRVDLTTGAVIEWQAPAPPSDEFTAWAWDTAAGRWVAGLTAAGLARAVRAERDSRLSACDWVVTRATELGGGMPAEWMAYRAALRAVPEQIGFPNDVHWPAPPV